MGFTWVILDATEGTSHILEESYQLSTELEDDDLHLFESIMNMKPNEQSAD
jgi:hypothetical protein